MSSRICSDICMENYFIMALDFLLTTSLFSHVILSNGVFSLSVPSGCFQSQQLVCVLGRPLKHSGCYVVFIPHFMSLVTRK